MSHIRRYRRNINCLNSDQLHDLREALAALYALPDSDPYSFATIGGLHGLPSPGYCAHGTPGFLTWHRAYMMEIEKALQHVDSSIMLPFWDWSSGPSTGVPAACSDPTYVNRDGNTVDNPLYAGPKPAGIGGGMTTRAAGLASTAFDDLATSAQNAMSATPFSSFQNQLNGVHGSVHVRVGGDMGTVNNAGFDPIFYLHHGNVDRLWAIWQANNPGALPTTEANNQLQPFTRPYTNIWATGSDFEHTSDLGYRYTNLCFFIPPIVIWEVIELEPIPDWLSERLRTATLRFRSQKMQRGSSEVRAFINQPRASAETKTVGNPHFAGSVGFFGMERDPEQKLEMVAGEDNFDLELDVTATLRRFAEQKEALSLRLVAVGPDGSQVAAEDIDLEEIELLLD
ncbi:MAG: tyrosinase family protein [Candidatus Promineifilaceae bacterium]|nr:tyrosinase family protein [Candidatus Promineifilaceae bacterium]